MNLSTQPFFPRDHYLEKIEPFIDKDVIKVITGQRRVGKSYFIYQIIDKIKIRSPGGNIIYINKERYEFDHIKNYHDLIKHIENEKSLTDKNYIFIDEIQEVKAFEKALRHFQSEGGFDIYCSGSNAELLSGELATYLSGRYLEFTIYSLSYPEFLIFHKLENNPETFLKFIKYGGLPYLVHLDLQDRIVYDYLRNVYHTILLKDVVSRYQIRNITFLENLVKFLGDNVGSILSAKRISDFLKSQRINISPNLILNYLSHLVSAFFIFKVPRAEVTGKKIFEIHEKYYFQDLGLRNTITPYLQKDIHKILENLVFSHLLISGYDVQVGVNGNKEIDFVGTRNGERLYVQVTYLIPSEETWKREFENLLEVKDNFPKVVVSMDETIGEQYKGIKHIHIRNFLSEYQ